MALHRTDSSLPCTCATPLLCAEFMQTYVTTIFSPALTISPFSPAKEQYNKMCQQPCGRREFARQVNCARGHYQYLDEATFLLLSTNFATILHLCEQEDDIESAKVLMILAFTYQCEGRYMYEELANLHIWRSMRFWNAAFLHAVHSERKLRSSNDKKYCDQTPEQRLEAAELQRNTFFGQLSSFIVNMVAFELPAAEIAAFREKMFEMSDLEPEQEEMLRGLSPVVVEDELSFSEKFESFKMRSRSFLRTVSKSFPSIERGHSI